jgi:hypothetical protein
MHSNIVYYCTHLSHRSVSQVNIIHTSIDPDLSRPLQAFQGKKEQE